MKDFERIIPEQAGVSSKAILRLLDELESGSTEPHGILIMWHGKICGRTQVITRLYTLPRSWALMQASSRRRR